ncbi:hypothetical protein HELRODRAFT_166114 [Helobdella robusta]|uniref:Uncharacterized protein n=1 Tax=Helobdella robusta TaxID=6412 RepID=T1EXS6_HELRO|nr:hypothetical protein HELRODRAFT_166114 [Helobdella robusta]ESN90448.1 hypothetical protein HELRODRAFT_166114 [Helobdella robusta]
MCFIYYRLQGSTSQPDSNISTRANSFFCTKSNSIEKFIFNRTHVPERPIWNPKKECVVPIFRCNQCLTDARCSGLSGMDFKCCQLDCHTLPECRETYQPDCQHNPVVCAEGETTRLTLEPVYEDLMSSYSCHVKRSHYADINSIANNNYNKKHSQATNKPRDFKSKLHKQQRYGPKYERYGALLEHETGLKNKMKTSDEEKNSLLRRSYDSNEDLSDASVRTFDAKLMKYFETLLKTLSNWYVNENFETLLKSTSSSQDCNHQQESSSATNKFSSSTSSSSSPPSLSPSSSLPSSSSKLSSSLTFHGINSLIGENQQHMKLASKSSNEYTTRKNDNKNNNNNNINNIVNNIKNDNNALHNNKFHINDKYNNNNNDNNNNKWTKDKNNNNNNNYNIMKPYLTFKLKYVVTIPEVFKSKPQEKIINVYVGKKYGMANNGHDNNNNNNSNNNNNLKTDIKKRNGFEIRRTTALGYQRAIQYNGVTLDDDDDEVDGDEYDDDDDDDDSYGDNSDEYEREERYGDVGADNFGDYNANRSFERDDDDEDDDDEGDDSTDNYNVVRDDDDDDEDIENNNDDDDNKIENKNKVVKALRVDLSKHSTFMNDLCSQLSLALANIFIHNLPLQPANLFHSSMIFY